MKVTVGLCIKNCEKTIRETFQSIINQDFPHELLEIIVVDGNSNDATLSIIKDIAMKTDIRMSFYNDGGKGLGVARELVVDHAKGEFIVWVDGDVLLPKDYTRKQVEFMDQNPKVGVAGGTWRYKGRSIVATIEDMNSVNKWFIKENRTFKKFGVGGCIYRVKATKQVGGFDKNILGAGEDADITYRIKKAGWLLTISFPGSYHQFRETWKDLWTEYFWWGYGMHYVYHKHPHLFTLWHRIPPVAFLAGLRLSILAYKFTHLKISFLLPLHSFFKRTAWWIGFAKGHINGYGHVLTKQH